jgi:hypothetical protein
MNLAAALACGEPEFLGHRIPKPYRVLAFFLEDDAREIQDKLKRILPDYAKAEGRLALNTREDFISNGITIDVSNARFQMAVKDACRKFRPDLIIFDNLAQMVSADYNNAKAIHLLTNFTFGLTFANNSGFNAAVLIAAHPRKRGGDENQSTLADDPEGFFENVMGSSHFVNSCGSLWGLERNREDVVTFIGGSQRVTGGDRIMKLEVNDAGRLQVISDFGINLALALDTEKRRQAWNLLPNPPKVFSYLEAIEMVAPAIKQTGFYSFWKDRLIPMKLVIETSPGSNRYIKAH